MKQRLIVLSADSMVYEDLEYLKKLPNYNKYLAGGAEIKKVRTIYPSLTIPAHASISTGNYPGRHGIISNSPLVTEKSDPNLMHYYSSLKCQDIFDAAKKKSLVTSGISWPLTGKHPSIDYLLSTCRDHSLGETFIEAQKINGSCDAMIKIMEKYANESLVDKKSPGFDDFKINCACDVIRQFKPELLMIHPLNIDNYRHHYGLFNDMVTRGIEETDDYIGRIFRAAEEAGIDKEINFFLVSDHGQLEIKRRVNINVLLAERGLIRINAESKVSDWDAYFFSTGLSGLVFIKDPLDKKLYGKVNDVLRELCEAEVYGIERVFSKEEIFKNEHLSGDFSFVIESDGFTAFSGGISKTTHGHLPEKGPQPVLIAKGPLIKENVLLERGLIVDEAPTFAKILGLELPDTVGIAIDEILK